MPIDDYKPALDAARIPVRYHNMQLSEICRPFADYLVSKTYRDDRRGGISVNLVVPKVVLRTTVLPVFSRGMVLLRDSVAYVSLDTLVNAVTQDNHPAFDAVESCGILCIAGFYDPSVEFSLTPAERRMVENFLRERSDGMARNCYAMPVPIDRAEHWSLEFRASQSTALRELRYDGD